MFHEACRTDLGKPATSSASNRISANCPASFWRNVLQTVETQRAGQPLRQREAGQQLTAGLDKLRQGVGRRVVQAGMIGQNDHAAFA